MNRPQDAVLAYFDAINNSDADKAAAVFTDDGALMADEFETLTGREQIRQAFKGIFQDMKIQAEPKIEQTREDGYIAFVQTSSTGSFKILAANTTLPADHRELFVLRKTGSEWLIAYYMFNDTKRKEA
jgi:uncharacterized protein (TIGR02246 family)